MSSLASWFAGGGMPSAATLLLLAKATFLLVVALIGTAALRKSSAGMRHLVWVITLASLVVLPAVASRLPLRLAVLPSSFGEGVRGTGRDATGLVDPVVRDRTGDTGARERLTVPPQSVDPAASPRPVPVDSSFAFRVTPLAAVATLWALGAALCLFWLAHGTWSVARIVGRATPMNVGVWEHTLWEVADRIGLDSVPRLVASRDVSMPFASGLLRPVIVLPADAESWSDDRRTSVLLHELAHIKRRDLIGHTLGRVACALYWFHPLVWTAAKRLRVESERACDDIALACGARPSDYAEQLLDIVTAVRRQFTPAVALAMAHRKEFEGRMLAILDPEVRRAAPTRRQTLASVTMLALMSLVVGAAVPATPNEALANTTLATVSQHAPAPVAAPAVTPPTDAEQRVELRSQTTRNTAKVTDRRTNTTVQENRTSNDVHLNQALSTLSREASSETGEVARELLNGTQQGKGDERSKLLMNILKTDTSANLRRIAAWGLSDHAEESGVAAALAEALRKDANAAVREMAAWALGQGDGDRDGVAALVAAAKSDADDKVRATALWSLGQSGDEAGLDLMIDAMRSRDARIRETAMWAIGNMEPSKAPREVITALGDSSAQVRKLASWVLFNIADESAAPALESALDKEKEPEVRRGIVRALAATGEKSTDALSKLLGSNDPEIRALAVKALAGSNAAGPWPWPWPKPRPYP